MVRDDYPDFLEWLYTNVAGLADASYGVQKQHRIDSLFGGGDAWARCLRERGHDVEIVWLNNKPMQSAWMRENGFSASRPDFRVRLLARAQPYADKHFLQSLRGVARRLIPIENRDKWMFEILEHQIRAFRPEVVINGALHAAYGSFWKKIRQDIDLLVGHHDASPVSSNTDLSCHDLIVSSSSVMVDFFRSKGINSRLIRLGFDKRILESVVSSEERSYPLTFVGSLLALHSSRLLWLQSICAAFPQTKVWGPAPTHVSNTSPILACYQGQAWGSEMVRVLLNSAITLNHHGDIPPHASNTRLFEATGCGALLITDHTGDLNQLFNVGSEIVSYEDHQDCLRAIDHYLTHDEEREEIALGGQERTLQNYTFERMSDELLDAIENANYAS